MISINICIIKNISKSYNGIPVLTDITLTVPEGQLVVISGGHDSGKTTLLKTAGLLTPVDEGELYLFGAPAPPCNTREALYLQSTQIRTLIPWSDRQLKKTISKILEPAVAHLRKNRQVKEHLKQDALKTFYINSSLTETAETLTPDIQQKLMLASLFLHPGELILADDPFSALNQEDTLHIIKLFKELCDIGISILAASNDPHLLEASDQSILLP